MKNLIQITPLIFLMLTPTIVSAQESIHDIYKKTIEYDERLKAAQSEIRSGEIESNINRSPLLPKFGISAEAFRADIDIESSSYETRYNGVNYSAKMTQPLYDSESLKRYNLSKKNEKKHKINEESQKAEITFQVANTYFNFLRYENLLETAQTQENSIESRYRKRKREYDLGSSNLLSLNEAENALDLARVKTIENSGNLDLAKEQLFRLTGNYYNQLKDIDEQKPLIDFNKNIDHWENEAINNNYELQIIRHSKSIADKKIDAEKSQYKPKVNFFASYERKDRNDDINLQGGDRNDFVFGLEVDYPIFTGGSTTYQVRKAKQDLTTLGHKHNDKIRAVRKNVKDAHYHLNLIERNIEARERSLQSAKKSLEATQKGYELGQRTFQDLLNSEQNYYNSLMTYNNLKYDYIIQYLRLKFISGQLSEQTIINLDNWMKKG